MAQKKASSTGSVVFVAASIGGALLGVGMGGGWHSACIGAGLLLVLSVAAVLWRK